MGSLCWACHVEVIESLTQPTQWRLGARGAGRAALRGVRHRRQHLLRPRGESWDESWSVPRHSSMRGSCLGPTCYPFVLLRCGLHLLRTSLPRAAAHVPTNSLDARAARHKPLLTPANISCVQASLLGSTQAVANIQKVGAGRPSQDLVPAGVNHLPGIRSKSHLLKCHFLIARAAKGLEVQACICCGPG